MADQLDQSTPSGSLTRVPEPQIVALRRRLEQGEPLRVLSIDGGGYLGLATAAFIEGIEHHFHTNFHSRFDLFCGTSTGAIIAIALAYGKTGADLVKLYETLGNKVFRRKSRGLFASKYGNAELRSALTGEFGSATLGDILAKGKPVLVTAFNISTGTPRLFKTDHSANLTRDSQLSIVDVALASSAAPIYFPLVRVTNPRDNVTETFCDGGVVANHPALLGFAEAISELGAKPGQVRILSLSTPRTDLSEGAASGRALDRGLCGWGSKLASVLIDANSMASHQILARIVQSYPVAPRYERVELVNKHMLGMDDVTEHARTTLKHLGATEAASNVTRARISNILA